MGNMATVEEEQRAGAWSISDTAASGGALTSVGNNAPAPSQQESDDQPMTLVDHLKELRDRLIKMCAAVLIGMIGGFFFARRVIDYFKYVVENSDAGAQIVQTQVTDGITTYLKITLYLGVCFAMPVLVYQIIRFLAPGLTRTERRYLYATLPFAMLFFAGGVLFASLVAIPNMLHFILRFSATLGITNLLGIGDIFGFFSSLSLWTGVFFEMPIVMFLLAALNIVQFETMRKTRKYAAVGLMIAAAVITPTPDAISMLVVWAPMYLLYELGLLLARLVARSKRRAATSTAGA
jgi:sec-independent protein translocase protein TatC